MIVADFRYINRTNPDLMLEDALRANHFALKTNDSILILSSESVIALALEDCNRKEEALQIYLSCFNKIQNLGDSIWASYQAKMIAYLLVETSRLSEAKEYINYYEKYNPDNSVFSEKTAGYYLAKGAYYEKKHQPDSAIFYYSKMYSLDNLIQKYSASKKLSKIYLDLNNPDSANFYLNEYYANFLKDQDNFKNAQLQELHVRFDYDRVFNQLEKVSKKNTEYGFMLLLLILVILAMISAFCIIWLVPRSKRMKLFLQIQLIQNEILLLKNHGDDTNLLEQHLLKEEKKLSDESLWNLAMKQIREREEYKLLCDHLAKGQCIPSDLKPKLFFLVELFFPIHNHILKTEKLNQVEKLFILLTLFDFRAVECVTLIPSSKSNISNYRKSLSERFFGEALTAKEFSKRIKALSKAYK